MIHKLKEFVEDELNKTCDRFDNTEDWDCLERLSGAIGAYTDVLEEIDRMNTEEMIRSESWGLENGKVIHRINGKEVGLDPGVNYYTLQRCIDSRFEKRRK